MVSIVTGGSDSGDNRPPATSPNQPFGCLCGREPEGAGKHIPGGDSGTVPEGRGWPPQGSAVEGG